MTLAPRSQRYHDQSSTRSQEFLQNNEKKTTCKRGSPGNQQTGPKVLTLISKQCDFATCPPEWLKYKDKVLARVGSY